MSANANYSINKIPSGYLEEICPGALMHLEFYRPCKQRITVKLIGYESGKYMIVRLIDNKHWKKFGEFFFQNNEVVARMLVENGRGECLAFKSAVRWRGFNPLNLLYLYYPRRMEKCELRSHPRVNTCIVAQLTDSVRTPEHDIALQGCISDVSLGGCCFEFILPDDKSAITDRPVTVAAGESSFLLADIKNQRARENKKLAVGLAFKSPIKEVRAMLSDLYIAPDMLAVESQ